jgi:hypothetical protein
MGDKKICETDKGRTRKTVERTTGTTLPGRVELGSGRLLKPGVKSEQA